MKIWILGVDKRAHQHILIEWNTWSYIKKIHVLSLCKRRYKYMYIATGFENCYYKLFYLSCTNVITYVIAND